MSKVLVTGGAGYIGSHICKALSENGHEPIVFDDLSTGHIEFVRWGKFIRGDIREYTLQKCVEHYEPQAIIHCAGLISVEESARDPLAYTDVNIKGTANVIAAAAGRPVIFSSTCAVYAPRAFPIAEFRKTGPESTYGRSKLIAEQIIQCSEQPHVILRYFNAAGASDMGEKRRNETHLIPSLLKAARDGEEFKLFGTDHRTSDGTAVRDYVHVEDLADAHVKALAYVEGGKNGVFNLGSGTGHSVAEVLNAVERITDLNIQRSIHEQRDGDSASLVADARKAQTELGWTPTRDLDQIIETTWKWLTR